MRRFFAAHPRLATGLHVVLASLPTALLVLLIAGGICVVSGIYSDWSAVGIVLCACAGMALLFSTGVFWLLSLLLYRFTAEVREKWPDRLRMRLIRLNIMGGFLTVLQVIVIICCLIED